MIPAAVVDVCATCNVQSLAYAVAHAPAHATIRIHGLLRGGAVIRVPLTITGADDATIAGGEDTNDLSGSSAAIVVRAAGVTLHHFAIRDANFAISAIEAPRLVVDQVSITASGQRGDPIRLWRSPDSTIVDSNVDGGRDVFVSWSGGTHVLNSTFSHLRYGLHDMYSPDLRISGNSFEACEIGMNIMYARGIVVEHNRFARNRGATGYGLALEDTDDARIAENLFYENHVGVHLIDSPSTPQGRDELVRNLFVANGSGLSVQSDARGIDVLGNGFVGNLEQVEVSGGSGASGVTWTNQSGGNAWSDYAGYDRDRDGVGDVTYHPVSTFETLADNTPDLQLFRYSAAASALDFATRALAAQPPPKLIDTRPLMTAPTLPLALLPRETRTTPALAGVATLLAATPLAFLFALRKRRLHTTHHTSGAAGEAPSIAIRNVSKRYPGGRGIEEISLTIQPGEAIALWGSNGAGKTTLLRAIIGETLASGEIDVCGRRVHVDDPLLRKTIGYAPQTLPEFELPTAELTRLIAGLRGTKADDTARIFGELGVDPHDTRTIAELSGGMRQRLCVALALLGDPPILVLDEPTAGLDRASRKELLAYLVALREKGKTIVFTSHLLDDLRLLATRVVLLENGRVVSDRDAVNLRDAIA